MKEDTMKIGIAGAQGTGKTTLAKNLAEYFGVPIIPDFARELFRQKRYNNHVEIQSNNEAFLRLQKSAIRKKLQSEEKKAAFISDTTIFDYFAVTIMYSKSLSKNDINLLMSEIRSASSNYNLILVLQPGEFMIEDDSIRSLDYLHQLKRGICVLGTLSMFGKEWMRISQRDALSRFNQAKTILEERYGKDSY